MGTGSISGTRPSIALICLDAFSSLPNPSEVLLELGRVLAQGGIAAFAEPGPEHSNTVQSQYEMRTSGVIENDIRIEEIWHMAQQAGFTNLKLAVFLLEPRLLGLSELKSFCEVKGKALMNSQKRRASSCRTNATSSCTKARPRRATSRYRHGLTGQISPSPTTITLREGELIKLKALVTNDSKSVWLPVSAEAGGVMLGCHVHYAGRLGFSRELSMDSFDLG